MKLTDQLEQEYPELARHAEETGRVPDIASASIRKLSLKEVLVLLSADSLYVEETGDPERGVWACLFRFMPEEMDALSEAFPHEKSWLWSCRDGVSLIRESDGYLAVGDGWDYYAIKAENEEEANA